MSLPFEIVPHHWLRERAVLLMTTLVFIVAYVYLYRTEIVPFNEYMGLTYGLEFDGLAALCFSLAFVPLLWLPLDVRRPSQMVLWFLYLMVFMPVCTTPIITGQFDDFIILKTVLSVFAAFALLSALLVVPRAAIPRLRISEAAYSQGIVVLFFVMLLACIVLFGIRLHVPSLAEIYGLREEFTAQFAHYGRLPGYAVQWFGKALTVLLFVYGMVRRRPAMVILAVLGQLYVFSLLAEKTLFFSLFFVGIVLILVRGAHNHFGMKVVGGTLGLMVVGKLQTVIFGSGIILFMTMRRVLVTPGLNTAYFFEYYTYFADKVYYAYNILGRLLPINAAYGYDYSPGRMVGMTYANYTDAFVINLNVNLWGEGFADFGLAGVFIATCLLAGFLWLYDSVSGHLPLAMATGILAAAPMELADSSLYTQMMTNGLIFLLILVYLMPPVQIEGVRQAKVESS